MKREELIKHMRRHGCAFVREGGIIPGGRTQQKMVDPPCRVITKSGTTSCAKYARTYAFRSGTTTGTSMKS